MVEIKVKSPLNKISNSTEIYFADKLIKRVRKSNSFGVYVDERLSWSPQIDAVVGKVSSAIGRLKQIRQLINKETALTIHNSLILPLFDYCDIVWDTVGSSLATRLQKLNNRAGRVISELGYEIRSSEIRTI